MTIIRFNVLLHARSLFARKRPFVRNRNKFPASLTAKQARDIGLSEAQRERVTFQWPSDGPDRPLL